MSSHLPCTSNLVLFLPDSRFLNLQLRIFYRYANDNNVFSKLTSTDDSRRAILETNKLLQDGLPENLNENGLSQFQIPHYDMLRHAQEKGCEAQTISGKEAKFWNY